MGGGGGIRVTCHRKENGEEKGTVEEYTCLSARGHFLIKHCTPSPSTGHLNSNSAVHTHSADFSLSISRSLSLVTRISNYKAISFVGNIL